MKKTLVFFNIFSLMFASIFGLTVLPHSTLADSCTNTTQTIYSDDTNTLPNGSFATSTLMSSLWTSIPNATWIWGTYLVQNPNQNETEDFSKTFTVSGAVSSSTLTIAADDSAVVFINGTQVANLQSQDNFSTSSVFDLTSDIQTGSNTIEVDVTNMAYFYPGQGTPQNNPGGVVYSLVINSQDCPSVATTVSTNTGGGSNSNGPIVGLLASPFEGGGGVALAESVPENAQPYYTPTSPQTSSSVQNTVTPPTENTSAIQQDNAENSSDQSESAVSTNENEASAPLALATPVPDTSQPAAAALALPSSSGTTEKIGIVLIIAIILIGAGMLLTSKKTV